MLTFDSPVDLQYDPYSAEALHDPTDLYRQLRAHYPAYPLPQYDAWAISRFDDVWRLGEDGDSLVMGMGPLFDPAALTPGATPPQPARGVTSFSQTDPPLQAALRQAVGAPLRSRAVARLEDDIRQLARQRLDELVPAGGFDLYADYGGQVSAAVMCLVIGLPVETASQVLALVNASMRRVPPGAAKEAGPARLQMHSTLVELVRRRRSEGSDGSSPAVDGLLALRLDGRQLSDDEIAVQLFTVLTGGTETVPKVVARCVLELYRRPDQLGEVLRDPASTCAPAYEEALRFGAPLQYVGRTAARDLEIAGAHIRAGQRIFLLIASANRDEREFRQADEFRWNRTAARHLAFGHGLHFCIGSHLARLEGRLLLEELLRRVPEFDLDENGAVRPPSDFQIGYVKLPMVPRASALSVQGSRG
jgi:cytochrome P450